MPYEVVVTHRDGFEYGRKADGRPDILRFGQVVMLKGLVNDGRLMNLGYLEKWDPEVHRKERCDCGRDFASDDARLLHLPEHETPARDVDYAMEMMRVPSGDYEARALKARGLEPKNIRNPTDVAVPDGKKPCPVCNELFAPQGMRLHVISCERKQGESAETNDGESELETVPLTA